MPKRVHDAIQRSLRKAHPDWDEDRVQSATYATLRKQGWKPHCGCADHKKEQA